MAEIKQSGIFILSCRLIMEGKPVYVQIRASVVEEREGPRLIVGLVNIDAQVRQEEEYGKRLAQAQYLANIDALTGIKNKNAFLAAQERLDYQIAEQNQPRFAMVVLDVNDLKKSTIQPAIRQATNTCGTPAKSSATPFRGVRFSESAVTSSR